MLYVNLFCLFLDYLFLKMKFGEHSAALYTQLTDRQLSIDKRLELIEKMDNTDSKQMIFDWLSGLVINRKK
jgi:hypothetical protein